jgi:hypothetical protein
MDTDNEIYDFDFGFSEDEINMMAFGEHESDENEMVESNDDDNSGKRQNNKVDDSKTETKKIKWGYVPGWEWCGNHKGMKGH